MNNVANKTTRFRRQIDQWVIAGLRAGACDFDSLLRELPSVYPVEVTASLCRLSGNRLVSASARGVLASSEQVDRHSDRCQYLSELPVPHPLDYDWRFTTEAVDLILKFACKYGDNLICLGTPTVFLSATKELGPSRIALLDRNAALLNYVTSRIDKARAFQLDVFADPVPPIDANVVVADPPWYVDYMKAFLWVAAKTCRLGGHVLLSLPPRGTRPTVARELDQVFSYATRTGFSVMQIDDDCLGYETPPFELNALRAAGHVLDNPQWRRGTLCVLRRTTNVDADRPRTNLSRSDWLETDLHGTGFRFRSRRFTGNNDPTLVPLVTGDVLPSVSRRQSLRSRVDVWTSGNRVYQCSAPEVLHNIVMLISRGQALADLSADMLSDSLVKASRGQIKRAAAQIEEIAIAEHSERSNGKGQLRCSPNLVGLHG